jgi:Rod binding domain-containing protein
VTPIALHPQVTGIPIAGTGAAAPTSPSRSSDEGTKGLDPKLVKAAQEFEAVFIRQLLKPLEKAGETGKGNSIGSGSNIYGSMMVGAVADQASAGGGIGLAEMVLKALTDAGKAVPKTAPKAPNTDSPGMSLGPLKPTKFNGL